MLGRQRSQWPRGMRPTGGAKSGATKRSADREVAVAQEQIKTTLRLERRRAARVGFAFHAMLEAAMGRVLADATEAERIFASANQRLGVSTTAYEARKSFTKSAFDELRSACVSGNLQPSFSTSKARSTSSRQNARSSRSRTSNWLAHTPVLQSNSLIFRPRPRTYVARQPQRPRGQRPTSTRPRRRTADPHAVPLTAISHHAIAATSSFDDFIEPSAGVSRQGRRLEAEGHLDGRSGSPRPLYYS